MSLSTKQIAFIDAMSDFGLTPQPGYSRATLNEVAQSIGMKYAPAWIVQDSTRRVDRGIFAVPEFGGTVGSKPQPRTASMMSTAELNEQPQYRLQRDFPHTYTALHSSARKCYSVSYEGVSQVLGIKAVYNFIRGILDFADHDNSLDDPARSLKGGGKGNEVRSGDSFPISLPSVPRDIQD